MAKKLTSNKAKEILHDKSVHGHPLTDKQRKFFGAIASGAQPYKVEFGGWLDKYVPQAQNGIEGTMGGLTDKGFNYNGAWGGPSMQMGGELLKSMNPKLAKQDKDFIKWYKNNTLEGKAGIPYDSPNSVYDFYSYFKNTPKKELSNPEQHFPDTYKLPNHPTFSNESIYSTPENPGGYWVGEKYFPKGKFGKFEMGGGIPGTVGFTYARTQDPAPSKGPYAKKTMASAQNGQEMKFYQEGLDWKPKTISQWGGDYALDVDQAVQTIENVGKVLEAPQKGIVNTLTGKYQLPSEAMGIKNPLGASLVDFFLDPLAAGPLKSVVKSGVRGISKLAPKVDKLKNIKPVPKASLSKYEEGGMIEDPMGQWAHPGGITRIPSNQITMQGVDYPVLGISDTGDVQMMYPNQDYSFDGSSVTEIPMAQNGYNEPDYITGTIRRGQNKKAEISNYLIPAQTLNAAADLAKSKGLDFGIETRGPADAVRHTAAAASAASRVPVPKLIGDYSPNLDKAIRIAAANLLGFGYELSNMNEGFLMDIKNNYKGSLIGAIPGLTDEERNKMVVNQLINKQLTVDNPNKKKENGGWLNKYN